MGHMRTDPSETGGLFVGRRPGTAPIHFRALPQRGSTARQRIDNHLANLLLAAMALGCVLCWGPIPFACLWIGSQVSYLTSSTSFGILIALVALFVLLFGTLMLLRRIDHAWMLVRRAAGHDQRAAALPRVFAVSAVVCGLAFAFWFIVIHGPGQTVTHGSGPNQGANL